MSNQFGPVPAPREELRAGHQRPAMQNPAAPAQGDPSANPRVRSQLAMGEYASPNRRVPRSGVPELTHLEHGITEQRPTETVTLTATSAHPENAAFQGHDGRAPSVTVAVVDAARAAAAMGTPDDHRASPAGARGMERTDWHTADGSYGVPAFTTPARPGGPAAIAYDTAALAGLGGGGGQLQGHVPDVQAPGCQWSTRGPNDGQSRFGRGRP